MVDFASRPPHPGGVESLLGINRQVDLLMNACSSGCGTGRKMFRTAELQCPEASILF